MGYGHGGIGALLGGNVQAFIPVIIIIAVLAWLVFRNKNSAAIYAGPLLVPRKFIIDDTSGKEGFLLAGRAPGLVAWLLTALNIDDERSLKLTDKDVQIKTSSMMISNHQIITLQTIASVHCGFSKNPLLLVIGGILFLAFLFIFAPLGLLLGVVFFIAYLLSRKLFITIETKGGMMLGVSFTQGVIENVSLDMAQAQRMTEITNRKVVAAQTNQL